MRFSTICVVAGCGLLEVTASFNRDVCIFNFSIVIAQDVSIITPLLICIRLTAGIGIVSADDNFGFIIRITINLKE